ncbi:MAG: universal stress protein [Pseudomonadota bacterium]
MLWNKILLVFDSSENSLRAVEYVAKMFGKTEGAQVTIFGVHEKIPRHDFRDASPVVEKLQRQITTMEMELERAQARTREAKALLARAGMDESAITSKFVERKASAVKDVLAEAESGGFGTIVLGRSDKQGLILAGGGLAKDLASQAKNHVVCVV